MRIFVGEYVCGGGLSHQEIKDIPLGLRQEGAAMLRAIVSDLAEVAETVVPLDPRFSPFGRGCIGDRHGRWRASDLGPVGLGCAEIATRH